MPRNRPSGAKKNRLRGAVSKRKPQTNQHENMEDTDVNIDGSQGEGGGQIVRLSLALSSVLGVSVKISKIRNGRPNPGLQAQHLSGAQLVAEVVSSQLVGGRQGSTCIRLGRPKEIGVNHNLPLQWIVKTAGATSLVLQAALPGALLHLPSIPIASFDERATLLLTGGTTAMFAPPSDYVANVLVPNLRHFGVDVLYEVETHGFFPKGGGRCKVKLDKSNCAAFSGPEEASDYCHLTACELVERGSVVSISGNVLLCGNEYIRSGIAQTMQQSAAKVLRKYASSESNYPTVSTNNITVNELAGEETGDCVCITLYATTSLGTVLGASAIWSKRDAVKAARKMQIVIPPRIANQDEIDNFWRQSSAAFAKSAAEELCTALASGAAVDSHMADQLCVFMAMAKGRSRLLVPEPTLHLTSVIDVCRSFNVKIDLEEVEGSQNRLIVCEGTGVKLRGTS